MVEYDRFFLIQLSDGKYFTGIHVVCDEQTHARKIKHIHIQRANSEPVEENVKRSEYDESDWRQQERGWDELNQEIAQ